jgi:hypothetical protein
MKRPADIYQKSDKLYIDKVCDYGYEGIYHLRKVNNWGYLRFDHFQLYLSETFRDTHLEVRPNPLGDSFLVCYRNFIIAHIDAISGTFINRKITRL